MMSKHLGALGVEPIYEEDGRLVCKVGNSALVVKAKWGDRRVAMRVYMHSHSNLRAIYGERYYPNELLICTYGFEQHFADVVLCDWYEGDTLQVKIEEACRKPQLLPFLCREFEDFARWLLGQRWAHGDIKPENIILGRDGLHLIDFDAMYQEGFTPKDCVEMGTTAFQHPLREEGCFGKEIDDYPLALIITVINAIVLAPSLGSHLIDKDNFLINPKSAVRGEDAMLSRVERLFAEAGDVRHYRIAQLLRSPYAKLSQLSTLLSVPSVDGCNDAESLTLEYYNGLWGFAANGRFVIPPLYDMAFDFSEGLALVKVGDYWHFIDCAGSVVIRCGIGSNIKPFRNGVTHITREDGVYTIYIDGKIVKE